MSSLIHPAHRVVPEVTVEQKTMGAGVLVGVRNVDLMERRIVVIGHRLMIVKEIVVDVRSADQEFLLGLPRVVIKLELAVKTADQIIVVEWIGPDAMSVDQIFLLGRLVGRTIKELEPVPKTAEQMIVMLQLWLKTVSGR